jgi:hypothetical protein
MTSDQGIVLSQPEAEATGMVAPGQESLLDEFVAEQEQEEQQRILGKFNSPEELAKAYQELEKKLGQGSRPDPAAEDASPTQGYTAEQAVETYGEAAFEALSGKGLDLPDLMWKVDKGEDISEHYDALAEALGFPRQLVEAYVTKTQAPPAAAADSPVLSAADATELKAMVGGDEGFQQLSAWAQQNLEPAELADYNAVVDSGNKQAISWALKAIQAKASTTAAPAEPRLISGGRPPAVEKFESKQQVLDAMSKRNDKGQKLYDVDDAYRQKVRELLARSDVF